MYWVLIPFYSRVLIRLSPLQCLVVYVGILTYFITGLSPKGDMYFSNVIVFTESSFTIDMITLLIRLPFLPFHSLTSYLRGRSIGLGQGLNWPRPGWTYPSRPPPICPLHRQRGSPSSRRRSWWAWKISKFGLGRSSSSSPDKFKS